MHTVNHSKNIVELTNVSFSYNENTILENVNLNIHRGDYLAIVGSNGSGKTTLLKIILGLLKPATGTVKLFGEDSEHLKNRDKIGYVPQKVTNFDINFPVTVEEVVLMGRFATRGLLNRVKEEDYLEVERALKYVEMTGFKERLIGELSGGQQQRVFIARALAARPEILFLDEPTVGVEKAVKKDFYALLRKLNEELDLTIVLITHDIEDIQHGSMHVACIDGTLFFHDSLEDYLEESALKKEGGSHRDLITYHNHNA